MSRPEFNEFAAVWQEQADPLEQAEMEADARSARRRGRLLDYIDYAVAISLLVVFVGGSFISTSPLTIAFAVPLMIGLTWMTWRRRSLRQMARTLNTTDRAAFLDTSLRNARANLRRATIGLASLPLVVPAAVFFKVSVRTGGGPRELWEGMVGWVQSPRSVIVISLLLILAGFSLRSMRRIKAEIRRLEALRKGYEAEAELDREG
jgi:hypothetical protein